MTIEIGQPAPSFTLPAANRDGIVSLVFAREHGIAAEPGSAHKALNAIDGYQPTSDDQADFHRHQAQMIGQFLIDRAGVVRWVNIERTPGELPGDAQLLEAVR